MSLFTITTRSDGTILTAARYNADRQELADALTPSYVDDASADVATLVNFDKDAIITHGHIVQQGDLFFQVHFLIP